MAKKIKLLILSIMLILALIINVNASFVTTTFNPPNIIGGQFIRYNTTTYKYSIKIYPNDYVGDKTFTINTSEGSGMFIGLWHNIILSDTIYKFSINLDTYDNLVGNTGSIADNNFQFFSIVSQNAFRSLNANSVGVTQEIQGDPIMPLSTDYYSLFWDKTSKTLSVIFCIPESYYAENISDFQHCYLITALGNGRSLTLPANITLEAYSGVNMQGAYTNILAEISNKLDMAAGGGLTQEQINEAIQDALTAHDEQLEHDAVGKLDHIMEQINGIVSPYKDAAEEINNAFDGLSDVFASSSTASVFKFPEGRMPNGVLLWQEHNIDIGAAWNQLPAKFRSVVQIVCTFTILYIVIQEAVFVIRFIILGRKGSSDD